MSTPESSVTKATDTGTMSTVEEHVCISGSEGVCGNISENALADLNLPETAPNHLGSTDAQGEPPTAFLSALTAPTINSPAMLAQEARAKREIFEENERIEQELKDEISDLLADITWDVEKVLHAPPRHINLREVLDEAPLSFYARARYVEELLKMSPVADIPAAHLRCTEHIMHIPKPVSHDLVIAGLEDFVEMYPFSHGYWVRFAEYMAQWSAKEAGAEHALAHGTVIYQRALRTDGTAAGYLPDLWVTYAAFLAKYGASVDTIRSTYKEGCLFLGKGINGDLLWNAYRKYEEEIEERHPGTGRAIEVDRLKGIFVDDSALKAMEHEYYVSQFFFHPDGIDDRDQQEWIGYLNWVQTHGVATDVVHAYERCLIPCAHTYSIWEMYAQWARAEKGANVAKDIWARAFKVLGGRKVDAGLLYADALEDCGEVERARALYAELVQTKGHDRDLGTANQWSNFERRHGNIDQSIKILKDFIPRASRKETIYLVQRAAKLALKYSVGLEAARSTFESALAPYANNGSQNAQLWEAFAKFEMNQSGPDAVERASAVYKKAIGSDMFGLSKSDKIGLLSNFIGMVEEETDDIGLARKLTKLQSVLCDVGTMDAGIEEMKEMFPPCKKRPREDEDIAEDPCPSKQRNVMSASDVAVAP